MKRKICWLQYSTKGNFDSNLEQVLQGIKKAATQNPDLIILPELCLWDYFPIEESAHNFSLAIEADAEAITRLLCESKCA